LYTLLQRINKMMTTMMAIDESLFSLKYVCICQNGSGFSVSSSNFTAGCPLSLRNQPPRGQRLTELKLALAFTLHTSHR